MALPEKPTPRLHVTAVRVNVERNLAAVVQSNAAVKATAAALRAARTAALQSGAQTQATGGATGGTPQGS